MTAPEPRPSGRPPGASRRPSARDWHRGWSLQTRLTVVATALLGAGLAAAGLLLSVVVNHSLLASIDGGATHSARDIAALVDSGRLPDPVPVVGGAAEAQVQVVDATNRVRAASAGADRLVALLTPAQLVRVRSGERVVVPGDRALVNGPLRVVGVPAGTAADPQTVLVAVDLSDVRQSGRLLRTGLLVGGPLLLGVLAAVSWRVIGWTLRPVEGLRRGAADISGAGSTGRLPLPHSHDEIHRLAVTLNDMLARIETASARQRAFVSDAAHELRSPLASLRTQLEVATRLHDPGAELAADLLVDVERLGRLVNDLLLLARLDECNSSGPAPGRGRAPVDLADLAATVVRRYPAVRVPVTFTFAAGQLDTADGADGTEGAGGAGGAEGNGGNGTGTATVFADAEAVDRVLVNLVDNAVRHAASRVAVTVIPEPAFVRVSVADDGPGIPAADRQRVFARFTRLDPARSVDAGGAGLGLAIVSELVRAHGGTTTLADTDADADTDAGSDGTSNGATASTSGNNSNSNSNSNNSNDGDGGIGSGTVRGGPGLRVEVRLPRNIQS